MAQLQDLFQTHAVVKILDHLTLYKDFEYTRTDIANETGISRRTLYQVWPILERFDLVKVTRSSGMVKFFKLNTENPISKQLIALADNISFFEAGKIAGIDLTLAPPASLPVILPTIQDQKIGGVEATMLKVKGDASQVSQFFHEMFDPTNGEVVIPTTDSTMQKPAKAHTKRNT